jgi:hypothetical protein
VYSRWSGTPADGHGHHQFAGYITPLAFKAAADPNQFPEQLAEGLRPWQTLKLYRGVNLRADPANPPTVQVQTGIVDPVLGRTYAEISAEGRSQHKSQEMGTIEMRGPLLSGLRLLDGVARVPMPERSIFDGIDVTVPGLAGLAGLPTGTLRMELQAIDRAAKKALEDYRPLDPARVIPPLAEGLRAVRAARLALAVTNASPAARSDADFLLAFKEEDFSSALARAAEVVVDPLADDETAVQGSRVGVTVRVFLPEDSRVKVKALTLMVPSGWSTERAEAPREAASDNPFVRRELPTQAARYIVNVPPGATPTQPYYLEELRQGDSYRWSASSPKAIPFAPPLMKGEAVLDFAGTEVMISEPVQFRFADSVRGELRREVNVVPAATVGLDSRLLIVPRGAAPSRHRLVVRAASFSTQPLKGTLSVRLPPGWTASPPQADLSLKGKGDQTSVPFTVTAPANRAAGSFDVSAEAVVGGTTFTRDVQVVAYPHIQTHRLYWPATARAQVFDLKVAPVRVGYIMGSGDQVPDALRRMNVDVTMIDAETLTTGDLARFDTIVVGVRASEARPDFVANNGRLLQYVERGGTLIVQYQQGDYVARNLQPYPAAASTNSRVTDENAPVKILAPGHPVFTFPNRITSDDFDGWVQERNLYAFTSFDKKYTPLLESADAGEAPQQGGELYAEAGKGRYVYTAYAWFRQLPAGVPGAYRQFANLISLSKAPR